MLERTLVFLKPDAVARKLIGKVIARFEDRGFDILTLKMLRMTEEMVDIHYAEHLKKPFYPPLKKFILSGPIVAMIIEGEEAVQVVRKMVGCTNGLEAESGTLRGDFTLSNRVNLVHASDSLETAHREIEHFFGQVS
ncbi:nucleoside-diphosphate kinase [bacterium]|nr:nucleoside-diphosphate kinase [bacterium]MBT5988940.1 nucleoside-diphosphate kinase [bacterium]